MRRGLVIGFGLAGLLSGSAVAQLPTNRTTPPSALPAGYEPDNQTTPNLPLPTGGVLPTGYSTVPPMPEARPLAAPPPGEPRDQNGHSRQSRMAAPARTRRLLHLGEELRPAVATHARRSGAIRTGDGRGTGRRDSRQVSRAGLSLRTHLGGTQGGGGRHRRGPGARPGTGGPVGAAPREGSASGDGVPGTGSRSVRFKTVNYKDQIAVLIGGFKIGRGCPQGAGQGPRLAGTHDEGEGSSRP